MALSTPAARRHMHTRTIHCEGFHREDGLWDIEARIIDTKTYAVDEPMRGLRAAGLHVHDMQARLTLDDAMTVRDIEVVTNEAPYDPCFTVAPAYKALIGARLAAGWRKAVAAAVGGVKGCTHLRELLFPMATVAYQTLGSWPDKRKNAAQVQSQLIMDENTAKNKPYFIDGCKAWDSQGEVVAQLYPMHFQASR